VHFDGCGTRAGYIRIDHGGGWNTTYYHLASMPAGLTENSTVSRGASLGTTGQTTPCGGDGGGINHVHWTVWKFTNTFAFTDSQEKNAIGLDIGGWMVEWEDAQQDNTCLRRISDDIGRCVTEGIYNDGVIGSGDGVGTRMMGDVDGDGDQDAVLMFGNSGTAFVARANPAQSQFNSPETWFQATTMKDADTYFVGDVNGDGKADLIGFWKRRALEGRPVRWERLRGASCRVGLRPGSGDRQAVGGGPQRERQGRHHHLRLHDR
jgi:murein DD-endopeptidase MepM/ murein hydrolase activator NlpD